VAEPACAAGRHAGNATSTPAAAQNLDRGVALTAVGSVPVDERSTWDENVELRSDAAHRDDEARHRCNDWEPPLREMTMFDVDEFIASCRIAVTESEARLAIKEVLERALEQPEDVARALPPTRAEIVTLHVEPDLTVLKVVWAPGMYFRPHDHLMWAAIGLYGGQEDNSFFRRGPDGLTPSGGKELRTRDIGLLGDDTIHAVHNPLRSLTGAIHIYGGDLPGQIGRSEWDQTTHERMPYDFDRTRQYFEEANNSLPT
jgi:predicted metal-dependent enzyme (double-stranded beta helix superfamily)